MRTASAAPALALALTVSGAFGQVTSVRTVALEGDQVPGLDPAADFVNFGQPTLNNAGDVLFLAVFDGPGYASEVRGVFLDRPGLGAQLFARDGDAAPGLPAGAVYDGIGQYRLTDAGVPVFLSGIDGLPGLGSLNDRALFGPDGSLDVTVLAREGDPAPGAFPGAKYIGVTNGWRFGGGVVTAVQLLDSANTIQSNALLFRPEGGPPRLLIEGDQAAGLPAGVAYVGNFFPGGINGSADFAFSATLSGPGVDSTNDRAVYAERGGVLELVVREGDPVADLPPGFTHRTPVLLTDRPISDTGAVVFRCQIDGPGVTSDNENALFVATADGIELRFRGGDPAPGAGPGVNLFAFLGSRLNDNDHVAFRGFLTGPGAGSSFVPGIFAEGPLGLQLIAREGDQVPGLPAGFVYSGLSNADLDFADSGQVAFFADATDGSTTRQILMITGEDGQPYLVAAEGELFDVDDSPVAEDLRRVFFIDASGLDGGGQLTDTGELGFRLFFEDPVDPFNLDLLTEGVFVATTIPPDFTPDPPQFSGGTFDAIGTTEGPMGQLDSAFNRFSAQSFGSQYIADDGGSTGSGPIGSSAFMDLRASVAPDGTITIDLSTSTTSTNPCANPDYFTATTISTLIPFQIDIDSGYTVDVTSGSTFGSALFVDGLDETATPTTEPRSIRISVDVTSVDGDEPAFTAVLTPAVPTPVAAARGGPGDRSGPAGRFGQISDAGPFRLSSLDGGVGLADFVVGGRVGSSSTRSSSDEIEGDSPGGYRASALRSLNTEGATAGVSAEVRFVENAEAGTFDLVFECVADFAQDCEYDVSNADVEWYTVIPIVLTLDAPHRMRVLRAGPGETTLTDITDGFEFEVLDAFSIFRVVPGGTASFEALGVDIPPGEYEFNYFLFESFDRGSTSMQTRGRTEVIRFVPVGGYDPCPMLDWNGDHAVDFFDLGAFLNDLDAQDPAADVDGSAAQPAPSTAPTLDDLVTFLDRFDGAESCPAP